ncbi:hypothetical protein ACQPYK_49330 (plasmid) [Streptosporangium sp. CA-135522]|uniref:hypothetical protein n=1 Tax=Streptosporangium sp. CA-135522 TaxID=3240072 RepID=UPI003D8FC593
MPVPAVVEHSAPPGASGHVIGQMWKAVAAVHAQEAAHLQALRHVRALDGYRAILARLYGFQQPAEEAIGTAPHWAAIGFDPAGLCRAGSLRTDLAILGLSDDDIAGLPRCSLSPITSLPQAVGVAFPLLGSIFGGAKMRQWITAALPEAPTGFFANPGQVSWRQFAALAEAALPDVISQTQATDAAVDTMHRLVAWTGIQQQAA